MANVPKDQEPKKATRSMVGVGIALGVAIGMALDNQSKQTNK